MRIGGWRSGILVGVLLLVMLGIGAAACSSSGLPSSAPLPLVPSAAAKGLCGSVSAQPIPAEVMIAVRTQTIKDGEDSGNPTLNQGATAYLEALRAHNDTAIAAAGNRLSKDCERLGIPTGHFNP
jgi:hypothetical protein